LCANATSARSGSPRSCETAKPGRVPLQLEQMVLKNGQRGFECFKSLFSVACSKAPSFAVVIDLSLALSDLPSSYRRADEEQSTLELFEMAPDQQPRHRLEHRLGGGGRPASEGSRRRKGWRGGHVGNASAGDDPESPMRTALPAFPVRVVLG
jgi:hypothetical protein